MKTTEEKYLNVIAKNTFYFFDKEFESKYENHIFSLKEAILHLKNQVQSQGCIKEVFYQFLKDKKSLGLRALLALTSLSNESLKRLITIIRIVDDNELIKITFREKWEKKKKKTDISEWGSEKIEKMIEQNDFFRKCIVNIFFEGSSTYFKHTLPTFEFHKFSIEKLNFDTNALIDTLARYKEKGSRTTKGTNNAETLVANLLNKHSIPFESGDLRELVDNAPVEKRTMDFIIPDKKNPLFIIESSFVVTTSSGQGDKSKTEVAVDILLKKHYPKAKFLGFVDGIGWYVRKSDLKRMVSAYEDVFTYHPDELKRFERLVLESYQNAK